jgi:UDP-N-acetylmuramoyl-L-alanyl-D-glutamate--2,6-diaminopimelate ligase
MARVSREELAAVDALRVGRMTTDSRGVRAGDTFVAYPGETRDGREFIAQAIANGADSVLWESERYHWNAGWRARHLPVRGLRAKASMIAAHVTGRASSRLWTVGVTGTNGKTSCSQWIARVLCDTGRRCAVAGTLGNGFPDALQAAVNTTPDAVWLQQKLRDWSREGARAVAMEVSSHGLDQGRVEAIEFDVALFTNLTRDHLDYHRTMARYRAAKARLFAWDTLKWSVLNLEDACGRRFAAARPRAGLNVLAYGFGRQRAPRHAEYLRAANLSMSLDGVSFVAHTPWGRTRVKSALLGRFNAENLLGTLGALLASGVELQAAARAVSALAPVAGRSERHGGGMLPLVVVDYAHTPDALDKMLATLRDLKPRQLTCVFGCGGDRDRGKRPQMGRIAARRADRVVVTSDNPRGERPSAIIDDILAGVKRQREICDVIEDRAAALRAAISDAQRGDIVLVAGKGHEPYQEIRGVRYPFSDSAVVRAALGLRGLAA